MTFQGSIPARSWDRIQADNLRGNRTHYEARRRALTEVYGLLKPIEATERYSNSGKSRIFRFECLGQNCNRAIVERSIHSVRTSVRDGRCPACPKCLVPVKDGTKSKKDRKRKAPPPEFENMGPRHCGYCGGMPWHRKGGICKGCEKPYAEEPKPARASAGLGSQHWVDGGRWL